MTICVCVAVCVQLHSSFAPSELLPFLTIAVETESYHLAMEKFDPKYKRPKAKASGGRKGKGRHSDDEDEESESGSDSGSDVRKSDKRQSNYTLQ